LFEEDRNRSEDVNNQIAYYGMNKWLQGFAYKIHLTIDIFILSAIFSFLIAIITVSFHSLKVANKNPVSSLRYE